MCGASGNRRHCLWPFGLRRDEGVARPGKVRVGKDANGHVVAANAEAARSVIAATKPDLQGEPLIQALVEQNVRLQLAHLRTHPSVAAGVADGHLTLHGWIYDIRTGNVSEFDRDERSLMPIAQTAVS